MDIHSYKWVSRHLEIARAISKWSKDPNTQVGSVIVTNDGRPVSWGFNGIPMGVLDDPIRMQRPEKYYFFAHAERNAIDLSTTTLKDCVLFCTHAPCSSCASSITTNSFSAVYVDVENGFIGRKFVNRNDNSLNCHTASIEMFTEAGVKYCEVDNSTNSIYHITKNKGDKLYVRKAS